MPHYYLWDLIPCNPLKVLRTFEKNVQPLFFMQASLLISCVILFPFLTYSYTMKIEAVLSSEMSVDFCRNTRRCFQTNVRFIVTPVRVPNPTQSSCYSSKFSEIFVLH
jgi:hypothetical protein